MPLNNPIELVSTASQNFDGEFFSEEEFSALNHLAETISPAVCGRAGAVELGTTEHLDRLLARSPEGKQLAYRKGLAALNYGKRFAGRSPAETAELLAPLHGDAPHFLVEALDDIIRVTIDLRAVRPDRFRKREWKHSNRLVLV